LDKAKLARVYNKLVDSKEDFKNEIDIIAKKVNAQKEAKKIAKTKALEAEKDEDDISEEGQGSGSADFGGDDGEEGDGEEEEDDDQEEGDNDATAGPTKEDGDRYFSKKSLYYEQK